MQFHTIQSFSNYSPGLSEIVSGVIYMEVLGVTEIKFRYNTEKESAVIFPLGGMFNNFTINGTEENIKRIEQAFHKLVMDAIASEQKVDYKAFFDKLINGCKHEYKQVSYHNLIINQCQYCDYSK